MENTKVKHIDTIAYEQTPGRGYILSKLQAVLVGIAGDYRITCAKVIQAAWR